MFEIPLTDTTLGEEEVEAATRVLRSKWLTMGAEVDAFEREFAAAIGCLHAIAVANGTVALEIVYTAADVGPGCDVIMPAITFIASLNAARRLGARAVLADITSEDDLTISVASVREKLSPATRLIVPMPHGGYCPDMTALTALARERNVAIVEDACHAPLAQLERRCIGTFGLAGTWSFFGNKNMTTGEGGMITTDDNHLAAQCRLLRSHGITKTTWDRARGHASQYDVAAVGTNARMDEVRAAIGRVQLRKLPAANEARTRAAAMLREMITDARIDDLVIPGANPRGTPVHHLFCVLLPRSAQRDTVMERMKQHGVQTSIHYPPLHSFSGTREYFAGAGGTQNLPVTDRVAPRLMTLPLSPHFTAEQCRRIVSALKDSLSGT